MPPSSCRRRDASRGGGPGSEGDRMATAIEHPDDQATDAGPPVVEEVPRATRAEPRRRGVLRTLGLGLITGAADDDCSAIGTYATAGAAVGPAFLWTAPVTFPMMVAVVYLSGKLGQVAGEGLFAVIRRH